MNLDADDAVHLGNVPEAFVNNPHLLSFAL